MKIIVILSLFSIEFIVLLDAILGPYSLPKMLVPLGKGNLTVPLCIWGLLPSIELCFYSSVTL